MVAGSRIGVGKAGSGAGGAIAEIPRAAGDAAGRAIGEADRYRRDARGFVRAETGDRDGQGLADLIRKAAFVSLDHKVIGRAIGEVGHCGGGRVAGERISERSELH